MNLTKKLKAEILKAYNAYWDSYFNGDMRTFTSMLDESAQIIGSSENEVFRNKASAVKFYKATAGQVTGKTALRNRKISMRPVADSVMITEQADFYALIDNEWTFYGHGRISTLMRKTGRAWKILYEHGSLPDSKAGEGEQINTERIKAENLQLRDAVKRRTIELEHKNWELKIEAALERVRAVAMSMRKPDELSDIGETVFRELQALGFADLRNTEILINNDAKESVLSYYYSDYGVSGAIEVFYNEHPVVKKWAQEMKKASDAFAEVIIAENEMEAWRKYREEIGYVPDPKLEAAKSVCYYSYSTGLGALSVSSFTPITAEQLQVLGRFRNVFGLAYRRYVDVAQAEAQAREAQIEAALERVRTKAMAMHKSEDLKTAVATVFDELEKLNLGTARCGIGILDKEKRSAEVWTTSKSEHGSAVHVSGDESMDIHPLLQGAFDAWLKQGDFSYILQGEDLAEYYRALGGTNFRLPESQSMVEQAEKLKQHYYVATFQAGGLFAFRETAFPDEAKAVMKRFAGVFNLTYKRFLDIQKAEAQAREAKIETAMEKVRARAMAMQKADELVEVAQLLRKEMGLLGVEELETSSIYIHNETTG
jgi:hypothetical protein